VASSLLSREPPVDVLVNVHGRAQGASGRLLVVYGWLLGPLLGGYLLLDRAFAYIHIPGTPAYVGELVLTVGAVGVCAATGYFRIPLKEEPVLALLAGFFLWGLIWLPSGYRTWGINAVRDFALCYYCFFAFFTVAALARAPELLDRWLAQLNRFIPWLLLYLPVGLILAYNVHGPTVPFSGGVPILSHAPGNAAIAAVLALGYMWLFPQAYSARSRALYSIVALVVIALSATQNRGGLLGAVAGAVVGLAFLPGRARLRLIVKAVAAIAIGLVIAAQLGVSVPTTSKGRAISVSQLIENVTSLQDQATNATGTAAARDLLWSLVWQRQVADGKVIEGEGWGVDLPLLVNDTQVTSGADPLRSPHNSHDDVLARLGLIGISLWIALWLGWYWRLAAGCQRLARRGLHAHRQVAVLCMIAVTAILVSAFFAPQLEGAQVAALLWTAFGVGVAVTSTRGWFRWRTPPLDAGAEVPDDRE
jgi:hypothetical protein